MDAATPIVPLAMMFHAAHRPGFGELQTQHVDGWVAAEERQQQREQQERHLDHEAPGDREERHARQDCRQHDEAGEDPERPELLLRRGDDGDDEQHGRQQLALRRQAVQWSLLVDEEVAVASGQRQPDGPAGAGEDPPRRRTRKTSPPHTTNVAATPTRPATIVPTDSSSTPDVP